MLAKSRSGRIGKCTKNQPLSPSPFFCNPVFSIPFVARIRTGVFLIGKTIIGRFSNKKLLEQRPMIVFRIRSCARPEFVRARRGRGFFSTQRLQICVAELGPCSCRRRSSKDLWRLGFIYTEFADSWRLDFIYTEIADTLVLAGLARR